MRRAAIKVMPEDLALKIAAGEVVERPAAVVKELIDNAIDAGARSIRIEVREAGLRQVRVSDDGWGIVRDDLTLAFTSHATSKIATFDDLERLGTLGFRGEALPSIAAVSRVEVQTRADGEAMGTRFLVEFGEQRGESVCSAPRGTRVTVSDLFGNVPARRTFVRSLRAEGSQIQSVVMQYALARPDIHFTLIADGRETFAGPGTGRLLDAIGAAFGADTLPSLIPVSGEQDGVEIAGFTSRPQLSRQNRSAIHVFVNGRPVQNRSLVFALEEAYSGYLMTGRHPVAVIHLTAPRAEVDANIHPSKSEVRFARERAVHRALYHAVANALLEMRMERREATLSDADGASESAPTMTPLIEEPVEEFMLADTPLLRVFGQANRTFIIAEGPNGLYMIDQHAAHERVLFDRFDQELGKGEIAAQSLLEPASVELTPVQMLALEENCELLRHAGFTLEPFGEHACLIRSIPAMSARAAPAGLVMEVLEELHTSPEPGAARERALAAMACSGAVKAGQILDVHEMRELVLQLERTARPSTCPHGRPTMIHLSHSQLEREFGRR